MDGQRRVSVPIKSHLGVELGRIDISLLPQADPHGHPPPLLDHRDKTRQPDDTVPIQLLEGMEYRYQLDIPEAWGSISCDKNDVLFPDTNSGDTGRVRTGVFTGTLRINFSGEGDQTGFSIVEIRARKLDYLRHYRWMLRSIASSCAELIMQRFAPTEQRFELDPTEDAKTLYQRYAFLKHLIFSETFDAAIQEVIRCPYVVWQETPYEMQVGRGIRSGSEAVRQLVSRQPRVRWNGQLGGIPVTSLPQHITQKRTETSLNNAPNQFIKFVLKRWQDVLSQIHNALGREPPSSITERGLNEVQQTIDYIDSILSEELFREVGNLPAFPSGSQVLQKREGYRDIYLAYLQFELASRLTWAGGEDVYSAGQKNVAALYEYWIFFELTKLVASLCDQKLDLSSLVDAKENGLSLSLKQGEQNAIAGSTTRLGRKLKMELWFNKTFSKRGNESWAQTMRPDCSVLIAPDPSETNEFEEVWVHFDAKYKIEKFNEVFVDKFESQTSENLDLQDIEAEEMKGTVKRADVLKMHAYRDAIRRSAGAYVLYPGDEKRVYEEYHELLPGLGAFNIRPVEHGDAEGVNALKAFINNVTMHIASQVTQHERHRYWRREIYQEKFRVDSFIESAPYVKVPPADCKVLVGYVKSKAHYEWIFNQQRYNVRADERPGSVSLKSEMLSSDLVLLYGKVPENPEIWVINGEPEFILASVMDDLGYPSSDGSAYCCMPIKKIQNPPVISIATIGVIRKSLLKSHKKYSPFMVSWFELAKALSSSKL